jgi:hypothetical protein
MELGGRGPRKVPSAPGLILHFSCVILQNGGGISASDFAIELLIALAERFGSKVVSLRADAFSCFPILMFKTRPQRRFNLARNETTRSVTLYNIFSDERTYCAFIISRKRSCHHSSTNSKELDARMPNDPPRPRPSLHPSRRVSERPSVSRQCSRWGRPAFRLEDSRT